MKFYNLGAQSHVRVSFDQAEYTADVVATGALRLLEAFRDYAAQSEKRPRYYQAGSSEMFGASAPPQNEKTPFYPRSPYAVSKVAAHWYGGESARSLRAVHLQRDSVQPRIAAARGDVCHAQDHTRAGPHQAGIAGEAVPRQSGRAARLGPRRPITFDAMWMMLQRRAGRFRRGNRRGTIRCASFWN